MRRVSSDIEAHAPRRLCRHSDSCIVTHPGTVVIAAERFGPVAFRRAAQRAARPSLARKSRRTSPACRRRPSHGSSSMPAPIPCRSPLPWPTRRRPPADLTHADRRAARPGRAPGGVAPVPRHAIPPTSRRFDRTICLPYSQLPSGGHTTSHLAMVKRQVQGNDPW